MQTKKSYLLISVIIGIISLFYLVWACANIISHKLDLLLNWQLCLSNLPGIAGIIGVIIFISSMFRQSSLLRIFMCYQVLSFPLWMASNILAFKGINGLSPLPLNLLNIIGLLTLFILTATCCMGLQLLSKNRVIKLKYDVVNSNTIAEFSPAPRIKRFVNRIIDVIIVLLIFTTNSLFTYALDWEHHWFKDFANSNIGFITLEVSAVLYFYLLLEGIFNITPGKCATGTTIVDEDGQRPGFGKILGRTFARFIPFDAFSFLGSSSRGWHDSASDTYVVETVNKIEEKDFVY